MVVCKGHFCTIYATTPKELVRLHKFEGTSPTDKRKGRAPKNLTDAEVAEMIENHIGLRSFPKMSSLYSRLENPHRRYLNPNVGSIRNMWIMFLEKHEPEQARNVKNNMKYVGLYKEWLYRSIFLHKFNLSIGLPRSDTCAECDRYKIAIQSADGKGDSSEADELHRRWDMHVALGDAGYSSRTSD